MMEEKKETLIMETDAIHAEQVLQSILETFEFDGWKIENVTPRSFRVAHVSFGTFDLYYKHNGIYTQEVMS